MLKKASTQKPLSKRERKIAANRRTDLKAKLFWAALGVFLLLLWLLSTWQQASQWLDLYSKFKDSPEVIKVSDSGLALMVFLPWFGFWLYKWLTREPSAPNSAPDAKSELFQKIRSYFFIFLVLAAPVLVIEKGPSMLIGVMAPTAYTKCDSKRIGAGKGSYRITTYTKSSQACLAYKAGYLK